MVLELVGVLPSAGRSTYLYLSWIFFTQENRYTFLSMDFMMLDFMMHGDPGNVVINDVLNFRF